jgi:hypothetical protein
MSVVSGASGARTLSPTRIDLGAPAAERDIERGLAAYFIESEAFHRVRRGEKLVILGSRGAGKSAIFQMLAQREREAGSYVIELAPEDYSYELLHQTMVPEHAGSWAKLGAYAVAWKYLIYIQVMQELTRKGQRLKGPAVAMYRYVRDNHVGGATSKLSALISYLKRVEGVKVGPYEASLRTRELEKLYKLAELDPLFPALKQVLERERVVVLVDELDRGWDASEDAQAFVAGLFQACMSINGLSDNLKVYMSLRQELYDNIPALYDDAQKFRDVIEVLSWDPSSLLQMIAARIRHSVPEMRKADDRHCWNLIFSPSVAGAAGSSFSFVMDRTLHRPREVIQLCAHALEETRNRKLSLPVTAATLAKVELAYSEERTKDIAAEFRFQYPGLLHVFETFRGGPAHFDREELSWHCLELIDGHAVRGEARKWVGQESLDSLIDVLWQVGFLQADSPGPNSSFLGPYQVRHLNLATTQRFRVHPMFWAYLALNLKDGDG